MPQFQSSWLSIFKPNPQAKLRLICIPYAGGSSRSFWNWPQGLSNDVELVALQAPGRLSRLQEEPFNDMELLVDDLMQVLPSILDKPYIILGHSLGSRIGFEVMLRCHSQGLRLPEHFIASGSRGPHMPCLEEQSYHLPDDQFIVKLREMEGTPEELLNSTELMALLLPMIKSDFQIAETYLFNGNVSFDIPLSVFGGRDDDKADLEALESWQQHFAQPGDISLFSGGHFFIDSHQGEVVEKVNQIALDVVGNLSQQRAVNG